MHPSLTLRRPWCLAGKNRAICIPFSPNARNKPSSWQCLPEMHAFRDQDGNILAPCIHFRAQSGDSGYMAREPCRQGPLFASSGSKSCMARRNCQRCPAFPRQRTASLAERTLHPAVHARLVCRMRGPLPLELIKCGEAQIGCDAGVRPVQKHRDRWAKAINGSGLPHAADNRPPEQNRIVELERQLNLVCGMPELHGLSRIPELAAMGFRPMSIKRYVVLCRFDGEKVVVAHIFHQTQDYARLV